LSTGLPADFLGDASTPPANANWIVWDENLPAPTVYQWNIAVQRELMRDTLLTVAYVGSSSNYLMDSYNWNGSPPGPPATEVQRRRLPQWNNINFMTPYGHASYHWLDVQFDRRYSAGLALTSAYTWGHSIDNVPEQFGAGGGGVQDFNNFHGSRGNSNFDVRHRWVNAVVYELPFGKWSSVARSWRIPERDLRRLATFEPRVDADWPSVLGDADEPSTAPRRDGRRHLAPRSHWERRDRQPDSRRLD
jgi:hypothetical protein